jgi:hypothetical protein
MPELRAMSAKADKDQPADKRSRQLADLQGARS